MTSLWCHGVMMSHCDVLSLCHTSSGMKTDFIKKIWKVRRVVTRATFAREAPRNPWIFHIWGLNNHPISVKHKSKTLTLWKSDAPYLQPDALSRGTLTPPPPLKKFFADLHWSQEWSWELQKNLKSDNYLKIFIPATSSTSIIRAHNVLLHHDCLVPTCWSSGHSHVE